MHTTSRQTLKKAALCHSTASIRPSIYSMRPIINLHPPLSLSFSHHSSFLAFFPLLWTAKVWCGGTNYNSLFSLVAAQRLKVGCRKQQQSSPESQIRAVSLPTAFVSLINEHLTLLSIKAFWIPQIKLQSSWLCLCTERFDYGLWSDMRACLLGLILAVLRARNSFECLAVVNMVCDLWLESQRSS